MTALRLAPETQPTACSVKLRRLTVGTHPLHSSPPPSLPSYACYLCVTHRYALENSNSKDTERITTLYKQFGAMHGVSAVVNMIVFICSIVHCWWLANLYTKIVTALMTATL